MFFKIWGIVLLLNQLLFYHFCLKPNCIISALPHTGIISAVLYFFYWKENQEVDATSSEDNFQKQKGCFCSNCKKENSCDNKFCIYCGKELNFKQKNQNDNSKENEKLYNEILDSYDGILVAFLAKVAKSDGKISTIEAKYISSIYDELCKHRTSISNIRTIYKEILNNEKSNLNNINELSTKFISLNMNKIQKVNLIETLVDLAYIDNEYDEKEENLIVKIVYSLHIDFSIYKNIVDKYSTNDSSNSSDSSSRSHTNHNLNIDECYQVLESKKEDSNNDIKKNYRRLVRQYHTDMLSSKDLPQDMIKFAEEKLKVINSAYEKIKKYRGIK
jgi:DnaJ like chaperone protein